MRGGTFTEVLEESVQSVSGVETFRLVAGEMNHPGPGQPQSLQPEPGQYLAQLPHSLGLHQAQRVLRGLTAGVPGHLVPVVQHLQTTGVQQDCVADIQVTCQVSQY